MSWHPQSIEPGQLYVNTQGRTVEILANDEVREAWDEPDSPAVDVVAYRFMGGTMIHLVSTNQVRKWTAIS